MTVELRRLRYFVAVAEELNFRRAAERLHLAQPALSQQIRKLELELGVQLLNRSRRNVALTAPGLVMLDEARRLLRDADSAARAALDAAAGTGGKLRVGQLADAVPAALPRAFARFAARHPGVEVRPEIVQARRGIEDVRSGRLDVAVVGLPAPTDGLRVDSLGFEGTVAAVAGRHPLSGRPSIPMAAFADTDLVVLPRATNPAFHDGVLAACREAGIAPALVETSEPKVELALMLVASGAGIALMPTSSAEHYSIPGVFFRPVEPPAPTTELAFISRSEPASTTVSAFIRLATARSVAGLETVAA
jgi:DNA-binding transcriptional LysR family regulator